MEKKGGVSLYTYYCVFDGHNSVTSYQHEYDSKIYKTLKNLYAVCIARNHPEKKVVGGIMVKTSYSHEDKEFYDNIFGYCADNEHLKRLVDSNSSFLTAKITIPDGMELTEEEITRLMLEQNLKHSKSFE